MTDAIIRELKAREKDFAFIAAVLFRITPDGTEVEIVDDPEQVSALDAAAKAGWAPAGFIAVTKTMKAVAWPLSETKNLPDVADMLEKLRQQYQIRLDATDPEALQLLSEMSKHLQTGDYLLLALIVTFPSTSILITSEQNPDERLVNLNDCLDHGGVPLGFVGIKARPGDGQPVVVTLPIAPEHAQHLEKFQAVVLGLLSKTVRLGEHAPQTHAARY